MDPDYVRLSLRRSLQKNPKNLCKNTTTTCSRLYLRQHSIPRSHFSVVHSLLVYTRSQCLTARMFVKHCHFGGLRCVAFWTPCCFRLYYCFRLCPSSCIDYTKRFRKSGQFSPLGVHKEVGPVRKSSYTVAYFQRAQHIRFLPPFPLNTKTDQVSKHSSILITKRQEICKHEPRSLKYTINKIL